MFKKILLGALCALLPISAMAAAPYQGAGSALYTTDTTPLTPGTINPQRLDSLGQTYVNALSPLSIFGTVLGNHRKLDIPITNSTSAYVSGYSVGGPLYFGGMSRLPMSPVVLNEVTLDIAKADTSTYTLYILSHYPTWSSFTDHAAPSINSADWNYVIDKVSLTGGVSGLGAHTILINDTLNDVLVPAENQSLYGVLVVTGTPTFANAQSLQLTLGYSQE